MSEEEEEKINQETDDSPSSTEENKAIEQQPTGSRVQTENLKPQTVQMEVHHHPDIHHNPKKWNEYFLEFLMIFLAVTLGFFAESYREHLSDNAKEIAYVKSMIEDLKTDSAFLELSIDKLIPYHLTWLDSTMHLIKMPDLKGKDKQIYQAFIIGTGWSYNFHPSERTLSQLHSEGYHLIRNDNAAKSLSLLEEQYKQYNLQIEPFVENMQNDIDISAYVFADRVVTDSISRIAIKHLRSFSGELKLSDIPEQAIINTTDKEGLKSYNDKLKKYSFYLQYGIKSGHVVILNQIKNTIVVLQKEYDLHNE